VIEHLTLGEFVVALSMGLAALCAFLWGAMAGAFRGGESIKHQVLRAEGLTANEPEAGHERPQA
jgi:cbb3-type cytochrome oxidase maturation protein